MCEIEHIQSCFLQACQNSNGESLKASVTIYDKSNSKNTEAVKFDRYKSEKSSVTEAKMPSNRISSHLDGSVLGSAVKNIHRKYYCAKNVSEQFKNKGTQTDYRESECQTSPWEPPYRIPEGHNPEVLTLRNWTWGNELPAGMHEMDLIHRMRVKRAWDKVLPPMDTPANIKLRSTIVTALEANKMAFRDAEIQAIMNLRMELAEKLMQRKDHEIMQKTQFRCKKLDDTLSNRKQKEIKNIKNRFSRELRRITCKHRAFKARLDKRDIIKIHRDRDSNNYKLKARYDCSKLIQKNLCKEEFFSEVECEETLPSWLLSVRKPNYIASAKTSMQIMCCKKARRDERKILASYRDVESKKGRNLSDSCTLLKRKQRTPSLPSTPCRSSPDNVEDEFDQSARFLQKLVRGRALQCMFLEGRNRYRELIEELRSARALEEDADEKSHLKLMQEEVERKTLQEKKINEILEALEGKTIAKMLTFLNEELKRLENDKKAHALALLAERERVKADIIQASKEQLELNRRRESDEIFRQIVKVNQDSVETYLEDIVKEGVNWVSEKEAEKYIVELAEEVEAMRKYVEENADDIDMEGMISDMVYNFILPEVKKESEREKLSEEQTSYLCAAHTSIYDAILNMSAEELLSDESFSDHANSDVEQVSSCELENEDIEELGSSNRIDNVENCFERIIEIIMHYTDVPDDKYESEVHDILEEMLKGASKNQQFSTNNSMFEN